MSQDGYAKLVSDAGGLALAVEDAINRTSPRAINHLMATELPQLEAVTQQLEKATPPDAAASAHARLVNGLRVLEDDLMAVQEEGTLAASAGDIYQTGIFFNSIDIVESGGRMRWELANSHGLQEIRSALAELKSAGFTASGVA
jgi:hypothetical protein